MNLILFHIFLVNWFGLVFCDNGNPGQTLAEFLFSRLAPSKSRESKPKESHQDYKVAKKGLPKRHGLENILEPPRKIFKSVLDHKRKKLKRLNNQVQSIRFLNQLTSAKTSSGFKYKEFVPSFKDTFRIADDFHELKPTPVETGFHTFRTPKESTPIDKAVGPIRSFSHTSQALPSPVIHASSTLRQNYVSKSNVFRIPGKFQAPDESTPIDNVVSKFNVYGNVLRNTAHKTTMNEFPKPSSIFKMSAQSSDTIEARTNDQSHQTAKMTNKTAVKEKENKRLSNPYAEVVYAENDLEDEENTENDEEHEEESNSQVETLANIFNRPSSGEILEENLPRSKNTKIVSAGSQVETVSMNHNELTMER